MAAPRYAAFISYSREADAEFAPALQHALQRLAKPWNSLRALRVFRDDASMSAGPDLWEGIRRALDASEFLILLASPDAAASPWVDREVAYWLAHRPHDQLMICLTGGRIAWSGGDFDRAGTTSVPPALFGALAREPRWVDMSTLRPADLSLQVPVFRDRVADLAAPLHHRDKDELFGEDVHQQRRTRRLVRATIAGLAALTLLAGGAAAVAFHQRGVARQQRDTAVANQMAAEAQRLLAVDQSLSAQISALAYRRHPSKSTLSRLVGTGVLALSRQVVGPPPEAEYVAGARASYSAARHLLVVSTDYYVGAAERHRRVGLWDLSDPDRPRATAGTITTGDDDADAVALSDDGLYLAVAEENTGVQLWDLTSLDSPAPMGDPLGRHGAEDVALSRDGGLLAVRYANDEVHLWRAGAPDGDVTLGRVPGSAGLDRPGALAFNPAGTVLAASTQNGTVRLWPLAGAFTRPPPAVVIGTRHADDFNQDAAVAFSPDSRLLATGGSSSEIQLWNVGDPRHPAIVGAPLAGHSGSVAHLAFAAGGTTLASAGTDRTVRLWDVRDAGNAVPLGPPLTGHAEKAVFVAFGPGAGSLLSLGNAGSVRLWRRPAARAVTGRRVTALAFSADGAELVAGEEDGAVHRWPVAAGPALGAATTVLPGNRDDTVAEVLSVRLTAGRLSMVDEGARLTGGTGGLCPGTCPVLWPDQLFVAALGPDGSVVVFSPLKRDDDLDQVFVYAAGMAAPAGLGYPPPGRFQGIDAIAFRPDGRLVAVGDISGNIRIWEVTGRKPAGPVLSGHADGLTDLAFAPDGRTLVSTSFDRTVRVWQLTDEGVGSPRALVTGLDDFADSAAFAPDGSLFATAGEEGSVRLWDPATAAAAGPPIRPQDNEAEFVRWSPDGRLLAVAGERSIGLIDLDPERAIARICAATTWIGPQQWRTRVSPELPYADVCA